MTQEERDLLLKDLYARIPYGVKILHQGWNYEWDQELSTLERITGIDERFIYTKVINDNGEEYTSGRHTISLYDDKPYLFPLSSMTEEQYESLKESGILSNCSHSYEYVNPHIHGVSFIFKEFKTYSLELIEWLNENHFDYRGLIEKGLALNATNLNIYDYETRR